MPNGNNSGYSDMGTSRDILELTNTVILRNPEADAYTSHNYRLQTMLEEYKSTMTRDA